MVIIQLWPMALCVGNKLIVQHYVIVVISVSAS